MSRKILLKLYEIREKERTTSYQNLSAESINLRKDIDTMFIIDRFDTILYFLNQTVSILYISYYSDYQEMWI